MQTDAIYQTLFFAGAAGVGIMGAMGAAHGGHGTHGHDAHGGGHEAHGAGGAFHHAHHAGYHGDAAHVHAPAHGHGADSHHAHHATEANNHGANTLTALLGVLSPLTLFSVSLGAGTTGLLLGTRFSTPLTAFLAALGGLALFLLLVRPLMQFARRFASKPARTLAGVIASEVVAQNRFDDGGRGIVTATLDGQVVRLLAYLEQDDHAGGMKVAPGDKLVVTQIDERDNSCRVTKL